MLNEMKLRLLERFGFKKSITSKSSFSQSGEDLIVKYLFDWRNQVNINYMDIGAYHPININNTYLLE